SAEQYRHSGNAGGRVGSYPQHRIAELSGPGEITGFEEHPHSVRGIASALPGPPLQPLGLGELSECGAGLPDLGYELPERLEGPRPGSVGTWLGRKRVGERARDLHQNTPIPHDGREVTWRLEVALRRHSAGHWIE